MSAPEKGEGQSSKAAEPGVHPSIEESGNANDDYWLTSFIKLIQDAQPINADATEDISWLPYFEEKLKISNLASSSGEDGSSQSRSTSAQSSESDVLPENESAQSSGSDVLPENESDADNQRKDNPVPKAEPTLGDRLSTYDFTHDTRGIAVIINNVRFASGLGNRPGSGADETRLRNMFTKLGFKIVCQQDLTVFRIKEFLNEVSQMPDHATADCFACAVLTHGDKNGDLQGVCEGVLSVDKVCSYFKGDHCRYLIGKPKLFFIQACRGTSEQLAHPPSKGSTGDLLAEYPGEAHIPCEADMLIAYATPQGYVAKRYEDLGTPFIITLCKVFGEHFPKMEIHEMLTMVNCVVAQDYTRLIYYFVKKGKEPETKCKYPSLRAEIDVVVGLEPDIRWFKGEFGGRPAQPSRAYVQKLDIAYSISLKQSPSFTSQLTKRLYFGPTKVPQIEGPIPGTTNTTSFVGEN